MLFCIPPTLTDIITYTTLNAVWSTFGLVYRIERPVGLLPETILKKNHSFVCDTVKENIAHTITL
ncbi:MAG: hypothetical protein M3421_02900 [Bacteroidota bacterium]|nr:hypothetical protein [Bacteroidota bacterium]